MSAPGLTESDVVQWLAEQFKQLATTEHVTRIEISASSYGVQWIGHAAGGVCVVNCSNLMDVVAQVRASYADTSKVDRLRAEAAELIREADEMERRAK